MTIVNQGLPVYENHIQKERLLFKNRPYKKNFVNVKKSTKQEKVYVTKDMIYHEYKVPEDSKECDQYICNDAIETIKRKN